MSALNFVKERYSIDEEKIYILGYSQGGARAFYKIFKGLGHHTSLTFFSFQ